MAVGEAAGGSERSGEVGWMILVGTVGNCTWSRNIICGMDKILLHD